MILYSVKVWCQMEHVLVTTNIIVATVLEYHRALWSFCIASEWFLVNWETGLWCRLISVVLVEMCDSELNETVAVNCINIFHIIHDVWHTQDCSKLMSPVTFFLLFYLSTQT